MGDSMSAQPLAGRVALVTGAAGSGIGKATAFRSARRRCERRPTDVDADRTERSVAELKAEVETPVLGLTLDVGNRDAVGAAFARASTELGVIDILVNNAAINQVEPTSEMTMETWDRTIVVDLTGPFQLMRLALPAMIRLVEASMPTSPRPRLHQPTRGVPLRGVQGGAALLDPHDRRRSG